MPTLQEWNDRLRNNLDIGFDLVRIYLGIGLFVRGLLFMGEGGLTVEMFMQEEGFSFVSAALAQYVTLAHLVGGGFLALGLLTRISALAQLPILFGAVFFVHVENGLLTADQSLEFAALVLVLLAVFAVFGAGRWSLDYYLFEREEPTALDRRVAKLFESAREEYEAGELRPERHGIADREEEVPAASATAAATAVKPEAKKKEAEETCMCGYDLNHPRVTVEPRYSFFSVFRFLLGISAPVKEVVYWCEECGTVLKRTRDPEVLTKYRYHAD